MQLNIDLNVHFASLDDSKVLALLEKIMSVLSDYIAAQKGYNTRLEAAIQGLGGDIKLLTDGLASATELADLADLKTQGDALATKFEALDALTPPAAPAAP